MNKNLKQSSILKIQESNLNSKLKATKTQFNNLKNRYKQRVRIIDNNRNLNKVALNKSESNLHNYAKFIVSLVIKSNDDNFCTEYVINNKKVDIFNLTKLIIIEVQEKDLNKKELNYDSLIQSNAINDTFIFPLDKFTGNLIKDLKMVQEKLYG